MTEKITVSIIDKNQYTSLVQWRDEEGKLRRNYLPNSEIELDESDQKRGYAAEPDSGPEYGDDLLNLLPDSFVDTAKLVEELNRHGIWSLDDIAENTMVTRNVLKRVHGSEYDEIGADLRSFLDAKRQRDLERKEQHDA